MMPPVRLNLLFDTRHLRPRHLGQPMFILLRLMAYTHLAPVRLSMNRINTTLLLLSFASALQAQTSSSRSKNTPDRSIECSVAGMVVKLAGSEPLKNASVQLVNSDDYSRSTSIVTDVGGRFTLK